jgi:ribosome maturation factor RimP
MAVPASGSFRHNERPVPEGMDEPRLVEETGIAARIAHLAIPVLRDMGYRLVRVKISAAQGTTVQVMAERPDGTMTVGDCEIASVALAPVIDVDDPFRVPWHLEMSSPGIDRPLVRVSDFQRAKGHEIRIEALIPVDGRKRWRGWIENVEGEGKAAVVHLRRTDSTADEPADMTFYLDNLAEARLILTESLVREALRASKLAASSGDAGAGAGAGADEDAAASDESGLPKRGPGRFSAKRGNRAVPMRPAGAGRTPGASGMGAGKKCLGNTGRTT